MFDACSLAAVLAPDGGLDLFQVPTPTPIGTDLLINVRAVGVCGSDTRLGRARADREKAAGPPLFLGHELVGEVVARGPRAGAELPLGTRVVALPCLRREGELAWFGESATLPGAYAETCLVDSALAVPVPESLTDRAATFIEPLAVAVHALERAELRPQDLPVVVGAGPLGLAIVVTLHAHGVRNVLVVERRAERRRLALHAGADSVAERLDAALPHFRPAALAGRPDLHGLPDVLADPRTVVFECAGAADTLTDICTTVPNGTRIIALGLAAEAAALPLRDAITKQLEFRFVVVYNLAHFYTAARLAGLHADVLDRLVGNELSLRELVARWPQWISGAATPDGKTVLLPSGRR